MDVFFKVEDTSAPLFPYYYLRLQLPHNIFHRPGREPSSLCFRHVLSQICMSKEYISMKGFPSISSNIRSKQQYLAQLASSPAPSLDPLLARRHRSALSHQRLYHLRHRGLGGEIVRLHSRRR